MCWLLIDSLTCHRGLQYKGAQPERTDKPLNGWVQPHPGQLHMPAQIRLQFLVLCLPSDFKRSLSPTPAFWQNCTRGVKEVLFPYFFLLLNLDYQEKRPTAYVSHLEGPTFHSNVQIKIWSGISFWRSQADHFLLSDIYYPMRDFLREAAWRGSCEWPWILT